MRIGVDRLTGGIAAACFALLASIALAAPPSATYFYPAGVERGQSATITAGGSFSTWPVELWTDRSDLKLDCDKEKGKFIVTAAADAAPGVAWVRLVSAEGASSPRPLVIGTLPELAEDEPNDELTKANEVSGPTVANGRLAKTGEVDCYSVTLTRGQQLVALVQAKQVLGSPMDGVLQVVNSDGFVLAQNDEGHGIDPLVTYTAPADMKVFVRLFAFPEVPTSSINFAGGDNFVYRLTLSTAAIADGALPLALQRGATSAVRIVGWNLPAQARELSVTAPSKGLTATVGHLELGNSLTLPLVPYASIAEQAAAAGQPQTIEPPVAVSGQIAAPNESDTYAIAAKKGERFSIAVAGHELGYPIDPHLTILDADGKVIDRSDDNGRRSRDIEASLTAPADGQYRLVVRDLYHAGSPRHFYRLTVAKTAADYSLSLAGDAFVLTPGKPLEIPVTVNRQNGFGEEIEVSMEGLPEGVTAEAVKSAPKGNSAKSVKLVLKAGDEVSFSGPIRIVGMAVDDDKEAKIATAALAGLDAATEDIWLTVAAKKKMD
jgi:hypothetical protein